MRFLSLFAASLTALLGLSGCESSKARSERNPAPCPNVIVLNDAARFVTFDGDQTLDQVAWSGEITDVRYTCRYFEDSPISGALEVDFALGRGPAAQSNRNDVTYFVAVTRKDREVIAREEFTMEANFNGDRARLGLREKINDLVIPRASEKTSGLNFEIVVGFVLERDQVLFNRSGKSLKFPNL
ncbi:MAG: hypothetical protein AAGL18_06600 [Pseudomonadota bacterium]